MTLDWSHLWPPLLWVVVGVPLVILASRLTTAALRRLDRAHMAMVSGRLVFYVGMLAVTVSCLLALKVDLTGMLATAGIATIAVGFAAQTSLSNYISGLFLIGEHTFRVGDLIRIGTVTGVVESIDLLSVKLRTLDNVLVRLPNEDMLKSPVTTVTRYPIRRMDVIVRVAHDAPLREVVTLLEGVARAIPSGLEEPAPLILIDEVAEAGFNLRFGVWFEKSRYVETRNALFQLLQESFVDAGIRFQLPRMVIEDFRPPASKATE